MPFVRNGLVIDNALAVRQLILEQKYSWKSYDNLSDQERADFHKQVPRYLQAIFRNDRLSAISSPLAQNPDLYQWAIERTVRSFQGREEPIRDLIGPRLVITFGEYLEENFKSSLEDTPRDGCGGKIDRDKRWDRCADCNLLMCHACMGSACRGRGHQHRYRRYAQDPFEQRRQQLEMARTIAPFFAKEC